ncbi:cytochrome c oxidase subunit II [Proteobacteria bacterium 005FR1]|nr:cytochrome c oxidase subunit II [Proteobacteria bacterium 005FR1]
MKTLENLFDFPFNIFDPAGVQAGWLANLGWVLVVLMSVLIIGMAVLVVWGALRRRGRLEEHMPIDVDGGKGWILWGGVALPVTVLTSLFVVTVVTLNMLPGDREEPALAVKVTAHQWWWEVDYLYDDLPQRFSTANEIHIPVGQPVRIELISSDVIHSFWIPKLHGKIDAIPGHTNALIVEAEEPGVYRGECAEYCGVQHAHMRFVVVAQPPEEYQAWAARQREPAAPVTDPKLVKGREAFEGYACALCHSIRGTKARGQVAPDLTHFASRMTIGGIMPNTRARLQAWIVNAQALKPGVRMPTLEEFDGETLNALAAYLESLE